MSSERYPRQLSSELPSNKIVQSLSLIVSPGDETFSVSAFSCDFFSVWLHATKKHKHNNKVILAIFIILNSYNSF